MKTIHIVSGNRLIPLVDKFNPFKDITIWGLAFAGQTDLAIKRHEIGTDLELLAADPNTKIVVILNAISQTNIRKNRKDIFVVAMHVTNNLTPQKQYISALHFLKENSFNLVFAFDEQTNHCMVVSPEEAHYHDGDIQQAIAGCVEMTLFRSHLTFTRSTVIAGEPVDWNSEVVPSALREVVNYCINRKAYKPFRGSTVGHFACKVNDTTFLTSRRKTNFNDLDKIGLVKIVTDGPDSVLAYGSKPSVGGQSQRIIFHDHKDYDCVVHFHCPIKEGSLVPQVSQREVECGSHQCGRNTSNNLKQFGHLSAVYLQQHGPNIVFHRSINPQEVIDFIEANFNLDEKTGGYVS